ncbi:N5 gp57-like protein [Roseovarius sp. 217 phage 1]|uniref:N5 gp57-like protein n=1 Tax=Roseovarius sp. 217 phage 1 TaxID=874471 RepID=E3PZB2_9CAUD|nr:N5 gp57-like protein [Roseovarius sp. 217 phage 1]
MAKKELDFDKMSDEDFLKLDEEEFTGNVPEGETTLSNNGDEDDSTQVSNELPAEPADAGDTPPDGAAPDESDGNDDPSASEQSEEKPEAEETPGKDPLSGEGEPAPEESGETEEGEQPKADAEEEGKTPDEEAGDGKPVKAGKETPAKAGYYKLPEGMDTAAVDEAVGFFQKITVPFKADGRDITVRTPEDAIRLMQQGVNYSRRMQEIKPMRQLNRMLEDQKLNDPSKLNFLIDLSKGDKAAITQLLKSHNIDPMDLDTEKDSGYQANNYQGTSQDNDFRDALEMALTSPEGQALVSHIHKDWDQTSKARLRENPSILGTLQGFKSSGVYDKVVEELKYQQSLGYLQGVPFLQAFDQVGEAMKNAGVLSSPNDPATGGSSMAPVRQGQPQNTPLATGGRKQQAPKKPAANPHLSSTPPSKQSATPSKSQVDFDKMSDEEFAKLAPPE